VITALAFYLFAGIMVASAAMVVTARNPVHSVLWLILAFLNAAGLFLLLGAEFLAMILMIVYVGAVAVLFLFVVMMLDINFEELRKGFAKYLPIGLGVGGVLLFELLLVGGSFALDPDSITRVRAAAPIEPGMTNTRALGQIVYTDYVYLFEGAGLILLVAMIGAIVLTHRQREGVKRQNIGKQIARNPEDAFANIKAVSGEGVDV
jgi:NADH-quinone oxidoreductase subunit J